MKGVRNGSFISTDTGAPLQVNVAWSIFAYLWIDKYDIDFTRPTLALYSTYIAGFIQIRSLEGLVTLLSTRAAVHSHQCLMTL